MDIETIGVGQKMKNGKNFRYLMVISLLSLVSIFSTRLFFQEKSSHDRIDISTFPYRIGDWHGRDLEVKEYEYQILETRNLVAREYANSSNDKLYLFIIYSETNRSVFHPPEVCFIGSGISIVDKKTEFIKTDRQAFSTNKLYAEKGNSKELILYSYKAGNFYMSNFYLQQAHLAINQIFGRHIPGATIRVSMPIKTDEGKTVSTLKNFLEETA